MDNQIEQLRQQIEELCKALNKPAISQQERELLIRKLEEVCKKHLQCRKERDVSG